MIISRNPESGLTKVCFQEFLNPKTEKRTGVHELGVTNDAIRYLEKVRNAKSRTFEGNVARFFAEFDAVDVASLYQTLEEAKEITIKETNGSNEAGQGRPDVKVDMEPDELTYLYLGTQTLFHPDSIHKDRDPQDDSVLPCIVTVANLCAEGIAHEISKIHPEVSDYCLFSVQSGRVGFVK